MIVHEVEQGSVEWHALRKGRPTASEFHRIITAKQMKPAAAQDGYICDLIGETLSLYGPENAESYMSRSMKWGVETEAEARRFYEFEVGCEVRRVGFLTTDDERFGCSPDGLVGEDGGLELKAPQPATQVAYVLAGEVPPEYLAQVHGSLIVSGRKWWDFLSYAPGLPPLLVRTHPNEFTAKLREYLEPFWERYQALLEKVRGTEKVEAV